MQGTLKMLLQHHSLKASILQRSAFFTIHLSYPYMTTGNTTALTIWTFISKVISLLLNKLYKIKGRNRNSQEIEENNRIGKTRDLFKKISYTKRIFHEKMGTIKDRNGMDLTEAEDTKKRWQEYTGEPYKKGLNDPDNHDGVITHLQPDILKCKVKWALWSITMNKASGGDGIQAELFQILKVMLLENTQTSTQLHSSHMLAK